MSNPSGPQNKKQCLEPRPPMAMDENTARAMGWLGVFPLKVGQRVFEMVDWQDKVRFRSCSKQSDPALADLCTSLVQVSVARPKPLAAGKKIVSSSTNYNGAPFRVFTNLDTLHIAAGQTFCGFHPMLVDKPLITCLFNIKTLRHLQVECKMAKETITVLHCLPKAKNLESLKLNLAMSTMSTTGAIAKALAICIPQCKFPKLKILHLGDTSVQPGLKKPVQWLLRVWERDPPALARLEELNLDLSKFDLKAPLTAMGAKFRDMKNLERKLKKLSIRTRSVAGDKARAELMEGLCMNAKELEFVDLCGPYGELSRISREQLRIVMAAICPNFIRSQDATDVQIKTLQGVFGRAPGDFNPLIDVIKASWRLPDLEHLGLNIWQDDGNLNAASGIGVLDALAESARYCRSLKSIAVTAARADQKLWDAVWAVVGKEGRKMEKVKLSVFRGGDLEPTYREASFDHKTVRCPYLTEVDLQGLAISAKQAADLLLMLKDGVNRPDKLKVLLCADGGLSGEEQRPRVFQHFDLLHQYFVGRQHFTADPAKAMGFRVLDFKPKYQPIIT